MVRRNTTQARLSRRKVLLYNSDDNRSSPPRKDILYMDYIDNAGRRQIKELGKGKTPNQYRRKHGG